MARKQLGVKRTSGHHFLFFWQMPIVGFHSGVGDLSRAHSSTRSFCLLVCMRPSPQAGGSIKGHGCERKAQPGVHSWHERCVRRVKPDQLAGEAPPSVLQGCPPRLSSPAIVPKQLSGTRFVRKPSLTFGKLSVGPSGGRQLAGAPAAPVRLCHNRGRRKPGFKGCETDA